MKKLSLIAIFALISMLFFVSCGSDDEDTTDTATGDTTADTTADTQSDTDADTTDSAADTATDTATDTDADTTDSTADTTADTDADTTADTDADTTADTDADTTSDTATDTDADTTDTGADTDADTMADTGSEGSDNLNTGDTSGNQAQSGKVGAACTSDSQCSQTYGSGDDGQEAFCLTQSGDGFPGGYCSFMCDMTDHAACDNAGGVYHANSQGSWGDGYCYHKCTKPSDCRTGYRCSNKIHACLPDCEVNECVYNTVCDETDKVCL